MKLGRDLSNSTCNTSIYSYKSSWTSHDKFLSLSAGRNLDRFTIPSRERGREGINGNLPWLRLRLLSESTQRLVGGREGERPNVPQKKTVETGCKSAGYKVKSAIKWPGKENLALVHFGKFLSKSNC